MRFQKIILVGNGKIACDCLEVLEQYEIKLCVLEIGRNQLSMLKHFSKKEKLLYTELERKEDITEYLMEELGENIPTLIVSANNNYLFPQEIVSIPMVEIINFHYSYLPDYRGVNIPTWVIFNGEKETGVSWHYVNGKVDDGNIILQAKIPITESTTAFQITHIGMQKGKELFCTFIADLLEKKIEGTSNRIEKGHCYKRKELPQEGYLDTDKSAEEIWRVLRAYDYMGMEVIEPLKIQLPDGVHEIRKYSRDTSEEEMARMDYAFEKDGVTFGLKFK